MTKQQEAVDERAAMMDRYTAQTIEPGKPEESKTDLKQSEPTSEKKVEPALPPAEKKTEVTVERPAEQVKMVPHAALHEEREKHKSTKSELQRIRENYDALLGELQSIKDSAPAEQPNTSTEDYDSELKKIKAELSSVKSEFQKRTEAEKIEAQRRAGQELDNKLSKTNDTLDSEGFPGFKRFAPLVSQELQRLVSEDPANIHLDNPQGWSKIYKETVYPQVEGMFVAKTKDKKMDDKRKAKEDANLTGSSAVINDKTNSGDDVYDNAAYLRLRKEKSLALG